MTEGKPRAHRPTALESTIEAMSTPVTHLLYLHGFRSSPQSVKARTLGAFIARHFPQVFWWCPQLPPSPSKAMALLQAGIKDWPHASMAVLGSSLGGFYATHIAENFACKAVLLNPAVNPARDLEKYIGEQTSWHAAQERFFFQSDFVQELRDLTVSKLTQPERYLPIIAKGDEVLDWREMVSRYRGARIQLQEGGDHALSDFEVHWPVILDFLSLTMAGRDSISGEAPI